MSGKLDESILPYLMVEFTFKISLFESCFQVSMEIRLMLALVSTPWVTYFSTLLLIPFMILISKEQRAVWESSDGLIQVCFHLLFGSQHSNLKDSSSFVQLSLSRKSEHWSMHTCQSLLDWYGSMVSRPGVLYPAMLCSQGQTCVLKRFMLVKYLLGCTARKHGCLLLFFISSCFIRF